MNNRNITLYIKDKNKRYKEWGTCYWDDADLLKLPYGIWHIYNNGTTNYTERLLTEEDIISKPLIAKRIDIKRKILDYFMSIHRNKWLSYEDMSCALSKILVPSSKTKILTKKGVRLRNARCK